MRIKIIVQRYGKECVGGAESHARSLVNWLKSNTDWDLEVVTTSATSYRTWANDFTPGETQIDDVRVVRFPVLFQRYNFLFHTVSWSVRVWRKLFSKIPSLKPITRAIEKTWIISQGPYCPDLITYLKEKESETDLFLFFTYLYFPTLKGLPAVRHKACLIPTAHDEMPFYFEMVEDLFSGEFPILVNTPAEKRLIQRVHPHVREERVQVGAYGLPPKYLLNATNRHSPIAAPYVFYLGRLGRAKSTDELIDFIQRFRKKYPEKNLQLVLAGHIEEGFYIPEENGIHFLGYIDDEQKAQWMAHAYVVANPSRYESLSLIVLEALQCKRLVLVNAHCEVLQDYASILPTVYSYRDYKEFEAVLCSFDAPIPREHFDISEDWVQQNFSWSLVQSHLSTSKDLVTKDSDRRNH